MRVLYLANAGNLASFDSETLTLAIFADTYVPTASDPDLDAIAADEVDVADAPAYERSTFTAAWDPVASKLLVDETDLLAGTFDLDGATVGTYVVAAADGSLIASFTLTPTPGFDGWPVTFPQGITEPPDFTDLLARLAAVEAGLDDLALADLDDVDLATDPPTDGQTLVFDSGDGTWKPGTVAGGTGSGDVTLSPTAPTAPTDPDAAVWIRTPGDLRAFVDFRGMPDALLPAASNGSNPEDPVDLVDFALTAGFQPAHVIAGAVQSDMVTPVNPGVDDSTRVGFALAITPGASGRVEWGHGGYAHPTDSDPDDALVSAVLTKVAVIDTSGDGYLAGIVVGHMTGEGVLDAGEPVRAKITIDRDDASAPTTLDEALLPRVPVKGDRIGFTWNADGEFAAYFNGVEMVTATDTTYPSSGFENVGVPIHQDEEIVYFARVEWVGISDGDEINPDDLGPHYWDGTAWRLPAASDDPTWPPRADCGPHLGSAPAATEAAGVIDLASTTIAAHSATYTAVITTADPGSVEITLPNPAVSPRFALNVRGNGTDPMSDYADWSFTTFGGFVAVVGTHDPAATGVIYDCVPLSNVVWVLTIIAGGVAPGGSTTDADDLASLTHAATSKTTPVDADELLLVDSAASNGPKKLTWANLKTTLGNLFVPQTRTLAGLDLTTDRTAADLRAKIMSLGTAPFTTGGWYSAAAMIGSNRSTTAGSIFFFPVTTDDPATIDALAILVQTGHASGAGHLYVVSTDPATGRPSTSSTVLAHAANVATTSNSSRVAATLNTTVAKAPGITWLGWHCIAGPPTLVGTNTGQQFGPPHNAATSYTTTGLACIVATGAGTSTTPLTSLSGLTFSADSTIAPIIQWRAA